MADQTPITLDLAALRTINDQYVLYDRSSHVVADFNGDIDPLRDKSLSRIMQIANFTTHTVTQDQDGAPDLISFLYYETERLWWVIMQYNALVKWNEVRSGLVLRIPNLIALVRLLAERTNKQQIKTFVEI